MALTGTERLRLLLGESIPDGGSESDTLFTEEEIKDLLGRHGTPEASQVEGWTIKAAKYAGMADTAEGNSRRALSDLHQHATRQVRLLFEATVGSKSHARTHRIHREGFDDPVR